MKRYLQTFFLWFCLVFILLLGSVTHADVLMTSGQYHETVEDLKVKVLGGYVTAKRTWYEGQWHFNRAWNPLKFHYDALDGTLKFTERNFALYEKTDDSGTVYTFGRRRAILVTDSGFRWRDRRGRWIDYDADGEITSYGDRNNVKVTMAYDVNGRRTGVFDHHGNQVLWYEYDVEGRLTAIRDHVNRRVEYGYTGENLTTVTDVLGHVWRYHYDSYGRLDKRIDAEGRETTIKYSNTGMVTAILDQDGVGVFYDYTNDSVGRLFYVWKKTSGGRVDEYWFNREGLMVRHDLNGETVGTLTLDGRNQIRTDRYGNQTVIYYDDWNNPIKVEYPDGSSVTYEYDPAFSNITRQINENGVATVNEYDVNGNLIRSTEAVGTPVQRVTEYEYDQYGQLTLEKRLGDAVTEEAVTTFTYDDKGNILTRTDPEGHTTEYSYDNQGNVLIVVRTDPRDKDWTSTYDAKGQLISETDPLGHTIRYEYDRVGNKIRDIKESSTGDKVTQFDYDIHDRMIGRTDALGNTAAWEHDADGHLILQADEEGNPTRFEYDLEGRLTKIIDGNGNEISLEYNGGCTSCGGQLPTRIIYPTFVQEYLFDPRGRLTERVEILGDGSRLTTGYGYDDVGNRTSETDRKGRPTDFEYDDLNRLLKIIDPTQHTVEMAHDNRDNVIALTNQNGHIYRFSYNRNNRQKGETWPLGEASTFVYDPAGNLEEKVDAENQKTEYRYDDAGRRITALYYAAADAPNPAKTVAFTYDDLNNLTGYDDGITSATYSYDDIRRKLQETVHYGPFNLSYGYTYYRNGKKRTYSGPDGLTYEYTYDANNQLANVNLAGGDSITYNSYHWFAPERVMLPGGTTKEYAYDDLMRLKDLTVRDPAGNIVMDYHYSYDSMNNVETKVTEYGIQRYSYDDLDRLIGVDNPIAEDEWYEYDPAGNRIGDHYVPDLASWHYNGNEQLIRRGEITYSYDHNGSLTRRTIVDQITNYFYNIENRLVEIQDSDGGTVAEYYYDPFGRRLWKEVGSVRAYFLYSDEGLVGEYDASGTQQKTYGYEPESQWTTAPLFQRISGSCYFYQNDYLGSPQKLMRQNGSIVWAANYEAFGRARVATDFFENNLRFPGQFFDAETQNHYNHHRYYDPGTGRYIESDPISSLGRNIYAYALENPLKYADVHGLAVGISVTVPWIYACLADPPCAVLLLGGAAAVYLAGKGLSDALSHCGPISISSERSDDEDRCEQIRAEINALVAELKDRYSAMLIDQYDLYECKLSGQCSWWGHYQQYWQRQSSLAKKIAEALAAKCSYDDEANFWVSQPPPDQPAPRPNDWMLELPGL